MDALLVIVVCLVVGVILRFVPAFGGPESAATLNAYAIYVALPALVIRQVAGLRPSASALLPMVAPWILLALTAGAVLGLARLRSWSREVTGALLLVVPLGNTAFLGLPMTRALAGPDALPFAVVYDQIGSFAALTIYGAFVVATYARAPSAPPSARAIVARIVVFPPFVALVLGLALATFAPDGLPAIVDAALEHVAASLVPVVLVAVGLGWRLTLPRDKREPLFAALALKLLATPLLAWTLVAISGVEAPAAAATIIQAAMGPMVTAGALATAHGLAPQLVAGIVGYGTLLCLLSAPVMNLLLVGAT